jgi:hypothetical protein
VNETTRNKFPSSITVYFWGLFLLPSSSSLHTNGTNTPGLVSLAGRLAASHAIGQVAQARLCFPSKRNKAFKLELLSFDAFHHLRRERQRLGLCPLRTTPIKYTPHLSAFFCRERKVYWPEVTWLPWLENSIVSSSIMTPNP